ncbi:hypothetical protein [Pseudomonas phage PMBT14]|uniref:Uncharacterized protein n=1 Tax=Pseudomonas phage PMBT14 TaxID=2059855 RepID=A0A2I6PI86_9CAUD|nr:hypothetical protein HWB42_gp55 [Pseudomonas phage PMBT14]AUM59773.1 hypothetical protein [Pseudomonas phage PMBT14]
MREYLIIVLITLASSGAASVAYGVLMGKPDQMTFMIISLFIGFLVCAYLVEKRK